MCIIKLHRMHEMQTTVTDVCGVCLSVCLSRGSPWLHCAKMAEKIKMLFGVNTPWGSMEHCVRHEFWSPTFGDRSFAVGGPHVTLTRWEYHLQQLQAWTENILVFLQLGRNVTSCLIARYKYPYWTKLKILKHNVYRTQVGGKTGPVK